MDLVIVDGMGERHQIELVFPLGPGLMQIGCNRTRCVWAGFFFRAGRWTVFIVIDIGSTWGAHLFFGGFE